MLFRNEVFVPVSKVLEPTWSERQRLYSTVLGSERPCNVRCQGERINGMKKDDDGLTIKVDVNGCHKFE